jgi:hypothetical protein
VVISWTSTDNISVARQTLMFSAPDKNFTTEIVSGLSPQIQSFTWTVPASVPKWLFGISRGNERNLKNEYRF